MEILDYYINAFAQGIITLKEVTNFYDKFTLSNSSLELLDKAAFFLTQSSPKTEQIIDTIESLPKVLKNSNAASILINNHFNNAIRKILNLPISEHKKSFVLLLYIFKVSDTWRRENICKNRCNHEWHNIIW